MKITITGHHYHPATAKLLKPTEIYNIIQDYLSSNSMSSIEGRELLNSSGMNFVSSNPATSMGCDDDSRACPNEWKK